ncbi:low temperature requirement protein A [Paenarthrobacter sp. NPDC089316]|uniref:low temperature requirement protein A n=1 Tax=unclassified Paenarthrobacter TaxID=2634190 RepID=UPI00342BCA32
MKLRLGTSLRRDPGDVEVSPLELFFDLVFVFAIMQLSLYLLEHLTWTGIAQTGVLYIAVFTVWSYTTWAGTLTDPARGPVRAMLLGAMLLGLFMNVSIASAFDTSGWLFVTTYLVMQIGRTLWLLSAGLDTVMHQHFQRTLVWLVASGPLWTVGAVVESGPRLILWSIATVVDLIGMLAAHPLAGKRVRTEKTAFPVAHQFERARLFFIIALGETVMTTGSAITHAPLGPMTLFVGAVALTGTITLWWVYFGRSEGAARARVNFDQDPVKTTRYANYSLMAMVAGLLAIAVGDELVIAHPAGEAEPSTNALLYGGPFLFFAAQSWYMRVAMNELPRSRPMAMMALVVLTAATWQAPPYLAAVAAMVVILAVAVADARRSSEETDKSHSSVS